MGRSTLAILLDQMPECSFVVADRSAEALEAAQHLSSDRVETVQIDVQAGELPLDNTDLVINLAGPFFAGSTIVAEAALQAGCNYLDIADDVEGAVPILDLHEEACARSVSLVTGAGLSPGVSNWLAGELLEEYPEADGIQVAWIVHESNPGGLAPLRHMLHMAVTPCPVWKGGQIVESPGFVPATAKTYQMPEPVGTVEAFDTAHPEPLTLSRAYPRLNYARCQGALQPAWANVVFSNLGRIGFGYEESTVKIEGAEVEPAEVLWKLLWKRYESRSSKHREPTSMVHVQALTGETIVGARTVWDNETMARGTGLGAAAAAITLFEHPVPIGSYGPEILPHRQALRQFEMLAKLSGGFASGIVSH